MSEYNCHCRPDLNYLCPMHKDRLMTQPTKRNDVVVTPDIEASEALASLATARKICAEVEGESKGYQYLSGERDDYPMMVAVLTALRAQVNQQSCSDAVPVAWMYEKEDGERTFEFNSNGESARWLLENGYTEAPLYTHPSTNPVPQAVAADGEDALVPGHTESGDLYMATPEKWAEYRKAWEDNDMAKVMYFETGQDEEFSYAGT